MHPLEMARGLGGGRSSPLLQNMGEDRKSFDRLSRYCAGTTKRAGVGAAAQTPPICKNMDEV